jgi:hypothetical protein
MTNRANHAVFKSNVLALIDVLKLDDTDVIGLALTLAASFSTGLTRSQVRAMLEAAFDDARGQDEVRP